MEDTFRSVFASEDLLAFQQFFKNSVGFITLAGEISLKCLSSHVRNTEFGVICGLIAFITIASPKLDF